MLYSNQCALSWIQYPENASFSLYTHTQKEKNKELENIKIERKKTREVLPSPTGREGKLIIPGCLEAKVLIDNHRAALRVYIAIRLRDKGWPKALISVVTQAKPDQPLAYSCLASSSKRKHFCISYLTLTLLVM